MNDAIMTKIKHSLNNSIAIPLDFCCEFCNNYCECCEDCYYCESTYRRFGILKNDNFANLNFDKTLYIFPYQKLRFKKSNTKLKKTHYTKDLKRLSDKVWLRIELGVDVFRFKHPFGITIKSDEFCSLLADGKLFERLQFECESTQRANAQITEYFLK